MKKRWIKRIPLFIGIAIAATLALGGVVMLLWNGILVSVLHVGTINFGQALGILVLSKILFGGFRGRRGFGGPGGPWRRQMYAKWQSMTDEEKQQFRGRMRNCRGWQKNEETVGAL